MHVPLPSHLNTQAMQWNINTNKDIEGVTPANLGIMFLGGKSLVPCTAQAMVEMIKSTGMELRGKEVVVVGSSNIVGKPLSVLLLQEMCTITICHIATSERGLLEEHVRRADIVAVAVGVPHLIKGEWIKEGAIVIDAGINKSDQNPLPVQTQVRLLLHLINTRRFQAFQFQKPVNKSLRIDKGCAEIFYYDVAVLLAVDISDHIPATDCLSQNDVRVAF
jgi:methylenetetrahydrofolate dehydrogenase (NADP+)/methenyltetrahydrofolate cyclohydrolase